MVEKTSKGWVWNPGKKSSGDSGSWRGWSLGSAITWLGMGALTLGAAATAPSRLQRVACRWSGACYDAMGAIAGREMPWHATILEVGLR